VTVEHDTTCHAFEGVAVVIGQTREGYAVWDHMRVSGAALECRFITPVDHAANDA
jgi:hypothetical protein